MKKIIFSIILLFFTFSLSYGQSGEGSPAMKIHTSDESVTGRCRDLTIQGLQFSQDTSDPSKFTLKGASDVAPDSATYITQTPNATLTGEQALSSLGTGLMWSTTTTGVVATIAFTANPFLTQQSTSAGLYYLLNCKNDADTGLSFVIDPGSANDDYFSLRFDGSIVFAVDRQGHVNTAGDLTDCAIHFSIDGGDSVIQVGETAWVRIPYAMTITGGWEITTDVVGTIRIDVWKDTYANYPPTDSDAMPYEGNEPYVINGLSSQDTSVAGDWQTTTLNEGDYVKIYVDSCDTATKAYLTIIGTRK